MTDSLYFDTARLGQITPRARKALCELFRYGGDRGSTRDFDDLLLGGFQTWPSHLQENYPGLAVWPGLAGLKQRMKRQAKAHPNSRVVLANRSSQLMRFTSQLVFGPCINVLITDCTWPNYERILRRNLGHTGRRITKIAVRRSILCGELSKQELVERIAGSFVAAQCDGLFLPAVDNLGVVFPIKEIVQAVAKRAEIRFVAVDGAQAFCQTAIELAQDYCDFFFTGCHKWLGAFQPMGVGFYGHRRSAGYIETRLRQALDLGRIDDPLLAFSEDLLSGKTSAFGETVNLASLFSCSGAILDRQADLGIREQNLDSCLDTIPVEHYRVLNPVAELRAAVLLLQVRSPNNRGSGSSLRKALEKQGLIASCYEDGLVRLAMPNKKLDGKKLEQIERALAYAVAAKQTSFVEYAS